jgi:GNAT superfamily N-acetyltransferase
VLSSGRGGGAVAPCDRGRKRDRGASVSCGRWLRLLVVARHRRREGLGGALLADAESRGVSELAAEPGHYFTPGVLSTDETTRAFLTKQGYERTATTQNLEVALGEFAATGPARPARLEEKEKILDFVQHEFGKIWRFEVTSAFDRDPPPLVVTEEDGRITGFAGYDLNNRGLGWFGPTGVAKALRGRGLGGSLLLASLEAMQQLDYTRAVIPWTDALAFYRRCCGAEPAHQFVAFAKRRT